MAQLTRKLIHNGEGKSLSTPTNVGDHTVTLGFGYTFIRRRADSKWMVIDNLKSDMARVGIALTNTQLDQLSEIAQALSNGSTQLADAEIAKFAASWTAPPLSEAQAEKLYEIELQAKQDAIKNRFSRILGKRDGEALFATLTHTREMAGLLSLAYNAESLIGPGLTRALWQGDRAEAWFQIRYDSNASTQPMDLRRGLAATLGSGVIRYQDRMLSGQRGSAPCSALVQHKVAGA
ncbi:MAG: hypothetical protein GTN84_11135 [Hydrogenophaga sp.]|nr:hypothetical protein [Hydrogenophaga sp.]NIM41638.1 hypothetical protein [Hydrogenophaga sp.]NIN26943.1 hypothetical protein [Hydrogenophaga sp.]NIN31644.1 hypothetical protein [Hydrogenophaga sp.]NIO90267.1 hypothetical protein [Hydrogenophaga sp.]NIQ46826.1 hypothetical protein [Hydrogenophaga sp.]